MGDISQRREMKANVLLIEEAIFLQFHVHKIKAGLTFHLSVHFTNCPRYFFQPTYRISICIYNACISLCNKKGISQANRNGLAQKEGWLDPLSITDGDFEATAQDNTVFLVNLCSQNTKVLTSVFAGLFTKRPCVLFHATMPSSSPLSSTVVQGHSPLSNLPGNLTLPVFLTEPS